MGNYFKFIYYTLSLFTWLIKCKFRSWTLPESKQYRRPFVLPWHFLSKSKALVIFLLPEEVTWSPVCLIHSFLIQLIVLSRKVVGGGGGELPIMAYTGRLFQKGIPLSRLQYGQTPQIWALKGLSVLDVLTGLNFEKMWGLTFPRDKENCP